MHRYEEAEDPAANQVSLCSSGEENKQGRLGREGEREERWMGCRQGKQSSWLIGCLLEVRLAAWVAAFSSGHNVVPSLLLIAMALGQTNT